MKFIYLPQFIKKIKELSKKYPSIKKDFERLLVQLQQYPHTGTPLGKDCFKIRLAIKSGKRVNISSPNATGFLKNETLRRRKSSNSPLSNNCVV